MSMLSNSVSGLLSMQRALSTTSHNVANANTPGYSRQSVELGARPPQFMGGQYTGNGTQVNGITRSFDQFVENQLRDAGSDKGRDSFVADFASQISQTLGDTEQGLSQNVQAFFNAAGDIEANPGDLTARQELLGQAEQLTNRFNRADRQLDSANNQLVNQAMQTGDEINSMAREIADLNEKISLVPSGSSPNDLLDRRDQLVRDLSERIDIRVTEDNRGRMDISIGPGFPLVLGEEANELVVGNTAEDGITASINGREFSSRIDGGRLGGIIDVQDDVINPMREQLGEIAITLAQQVNEIQDEGIDLNGDTGAPMFAMTGIDLNNIEPGDAFGAAGRLQVAMSDPEAIAAAAPGEGSRGNGNIQNLIGLADEPQGDLNNRTLSGALGDFVSRAGSVASQAKANADTSEATYDSLMARRESVSGVNLDEEAANLLAYQQNYQALSRTISVSDQLFQSILNAVG